MLHLVGGGCPRGVAGQPLLAGLEELFRPIVIEALGNALTPAQRGNALLATQAFQHDADLLLRRILFAGGAADVLDDLLCRLFLCPGFPSHLRSLKGYDEPEILLYPLSRNCLIGAEPGHHKLARAYGALNGKRITKRCANIYDQADFSLARSITLQYSRHVYDDHLIQLFRHVFKLGGVTGNRFIGAMRDPVHVPADLISYDCL